MSEHNRKVTIAYITESLGAGGAERQLVELIKYLDRTRFNARVVTYYPDNFYRAELDELNVPTYRINRKGKWDLRPAMQLAHWLRSGEVDIVHAYLTTANFYAALAGRLARRGRIIATERCDWRRVTGRVRLYGNWAYRQADLVIANSDSARVNLMADLKLAADHTLFIPNGLDVNRFAPADRAARAALRDRLGWTDSQRSVLTVASFKPQKNHLGLVEALADFDLARTSLQFYWAGPPAPSSSFEQVKHRIDQLHLNDVIHFLGPRADVIDLYRACDVMVLNSLFEGTPNVVLEALACGRPVVATDVSDVSRYVLPGRTGWLIPAGDQAALRRALFEVSQMTPADLDRMGAQGREHVLQLKMDPDSLARRYEQLYVELLESTRP